MLLDIEQLDTFYSLFLREFRQVKIELEPVDKNGNFESSYYNTIEKKPSSPPQNGEKYLGDSSAKTYQKEKEKLISLYNRLASVPRITREILAIIVERGRFRPTSLISDKYGIIPESLEKIMRIDQRELLNEINILEDAGLVYIVQEEIDNRPVTFLVISDQNLNYLFNWLVEETLSVRQLINTMDFTVLDK